MVLSILTFTTLAGLVKKAFSSLTSDLTIFNILIKLPIISYDDSVKLIKEKRDYYNALLRNGFRIPDIK